MLTRFRKDLASRARKIGDRSCARRPRRFPHVWIISGCLKELEEEPSRRLMICIKRDTLFENYRHFVERLSESVIRLNTGQRTATFDKLYKESEHNWHSPRWALRLTLVIVAGPAR